VLTIKSIEALEPAKLTEAHKAKVLATLAARRKRRASGELTPAEVEAAKHELTPQEMLAAGAEVIVWDTDTGGKGALPSFGLRVKPSGQKSFLIQYRKGTATRRITLARFHRDAYPPEHARKVAGKELRKASDGGDPAADRKAVRGMPTVAEFAQRYLAGYATPPNKKPRSCAEDARNLKLHVIPALGRKTIAEVTDVDIDRLYKRLASDPDTGKVTAARANRVWALCSTMFGLAETREFGRLRPAGSNPCRGIRRLAERKRERYLSANELAKLADVLAEAERTQTEPQAAIHLIKLLLFTGCRLGEIQTLRWEHVDFERAMLRLPDSKTGAKAVHLNAPALEVLAAIEHVEDNPYVIVGRKEGSYLVGCQHPWQRLRRKAGIADVRIHDLRHSYASILAGLGEGLPMIGKLLGHAKTSTTERYAHLAADPVKKAAERAGAALLGMMAGKTAQVMELPQRRR
jgi:integrase